MKELDVLLSTFHSLSSLTKQNVASLPVLSFNRPLGSDHGKSDPTKNTSAVSPKIPDLEAVGIELNQLITFSVGRSIPKGCIY
jgi:hypothetical protein